MLYYIFTDRFTCGSSLRGRPPYTISFRFDEDLANCKLRRGEMHVVLAQSFFGSSLVHSMYWQAMDTGYTEGI